MKRIAFLIAGLVAFTMVNAQTETNENTGEINTVFGKNGRPAVGWFIGLDHGYTQFESRDVWTGGLNFGMIIDHKFSIGLTGTGWTNRNGMYYENISGDDGAYLEGGYGGLLLEYTLFPKSLVHLTIPVMIGGGGVSYISESDIPVWDEDEWDFDNVVIDDDLFFVVEPGIRAEMNVFRFMRLNAGVSYRHTEGLQMINTSEDLMNNFTATVGLKFGKF